MPWGTTVLIVEATGLWITGVGLRETGALSRVRTTDTRLPRSVRPGALGTRWAAVLHLGADVAARTVHATRLSRCILVRARLTHQAVIWHGESLHSHNMGHLSIINTTVPVHSGTCQADTSGSNLARTEFTFTQHGTFVYNQHNCPGAFWYVPGWHIRQ